MRSSTRGFALMFNSQLLTAPGRVTATCGGSPRFVRRAVTAYVLSHAGRFGEGSNPSGSDC